MIFKFIYSLIKKIFLEVLIILVDTSFFVKIIYIENVFISKIINIGKYLYIEILLYMKNGLEIFYI